MSKFIKVSLILLLASIAHAQYTRNFILHGAGAPVGNCASVTLLYNDTSTPDLYYCPVPGAAWVKVTSSGATTVTSVSNSDSTLTISPTTGAVVASLNLAHANTWVGAQTFGTITPTTIAGNVTFSGAAALGTPASGVVTNLTGTGAFNTSGTSGGLTGTISTSGGTLSVGTTGTTGVININGSTAGVAAPITTGASGLTVIMPTGNTTNPGLNFVSNNSNSGFIGNGAGGAEFITSGSVGLGVGANGIFTLNSNAFYFTRSGSREAGIDDESAATGSIVLGAGSSSNGNEGALLRSANICRLQADVTLSTSATNVCSFSLPAVAKTWYFTCTLPWSVTAGTTPTISFGVNASQTPNVTTNVYGEIKTTNTNTATEASAALSASGAVNVITSPTLTTSSTVFMASMSGTLGASATAGTFAITATGTGASFAGGVRNGGGCVLQ